MREPFYTRPVLLDRERDRRSSIGTKPVAHREPHGPGERVVVCAVCEHPITDEECRMEMNGAHEHVFVNPAGFQYVIGCWSAAPGCAHLGSPETAFSWFPGWTWQIAACARCRAHLGWVYRNADQQFHGLIADRVRAIDT